MTIENMEQPSEMTADAERAWARPLIMLPLFVLLSAVGGLLPSFSLLANLYVIGIGGTLFWLGVSGRVARRPVPARLGRSSAWWLLPSLTLALIELAMFIGGSTSSYPTLSLLADPLLEVYLARAAVYFGWITAFWGLVRR